MLVVFVLVHVPSPTQFDRPPVVEQQFVVVQAVQNDLLRGVPLAASRQLLPDIVVQSHAIVIPREHVSQLASLQVSLQALLAASNS